MPIVTSASASGSPAIILALLVAVPTTCYLLVLPWFLSAMGWIIITRRGVSLQPSELDGTPDRR